MTKSQRKISKLIALGTMKKKTTIFLKNIFTVFILSLLWACNANPTQPPTTIPTITPTAEPTATSTHIPPTLRPSNTPSPTVTPTITSTPGPTLAAHVWTSSKPLIYFYSYGGDGSCNLASPLPDFILLSDGQLFFLDHTWSRQTAKLSREETCNLLNSIDQAGFFDYDPSTYGDPLQTTGIMGTDSTGISIQAWRSNSIGLYGLSFFINEAPACSTCSTEGFPTILPALRKTYQLLKNYQPAHAEVVQSDRIGVWINVGYGVDEHPLAWPLKTIRLSDIVNRPSPEIILTGEDAEVVYQLYIKSTGLCSASVTDGGKVYEIVVRHLMPYEYPSIAPKPNTISCSPADGWIEIP